MSDKPTVPTDDEIDTWVNAHQSYENDQYLIKSDLVDEYVKQVRDRTLQSSLDKFRRVPVGVCCPCCGRAKE